MSRQRGTDSILSEKEDDVSMDIYEANAHGKEEDTVCPFCGSNHTKINYNFTKVGTTGLDDIVYIVRYSVRCTRCFARGPVASGKVLSLERYPVNIAYELPEWATIWQKVRAKAIRLWQTNNGGDV